MPEKKGFEAGGGWGVDPWQRERDWLRRLNISTPNWRTFLPAIPGAGPVAATVGAMFPNWTWGQKQPTTPSWVGTSSDVTKLLGQARQQPQPPEPTPTMTPGEAAELWARGIEEDRARREWADLEFRKQQASQQQALAQAQLRAGQAGTEGQEKLQMQAALLGLLGDISRHPQNWIQAHYANQIIASLQWLMQERRSKGGEKTVMATSPKEAAAMGGTSWVPPERVEEALTQQWGQYYSTAPQMSELEMALGGVLPEPSQGAYPQPTYESALGQAAAQGTFATGRGGGGRGEPPEVGRPPATPEWLIKYAPSLKAGQPLKAAEVITPSAQAWQRIPWSEQQMLGGYLDWASGIGAFREMQEQIARSIPRRPTLGRQWSPPQQFA